MSHGQGRLVELTTDGVPPAQRLAFWRDEVLKRMEPTAASEADGPFREFPTFTRMFKRRFGMTPRDAREAAFANHPRGTT